jgi:hypothetical protein
MRLRTLLAASLVLALALAAYARPPRQQKDSVTEISLEMTQIALLEGGSAGRALKVVLRRDGTALFEGKANVKLLGKYRGSISEAEFERLAEFLKSRKYSKIHENLPEYWIEPPAGTLVASAPSPAVITSVESGGRRKTVVRETFEQGSNRRKPPKEIFEIEQAIMDAAMRIKWAKSE